MRPISDFGNATLWSFYRQWYFYIRDRLFVSLISASPHCRAVHFQEYTPWLMSRHFDRLKKAGFHLFYTVHGVYPHRYMDGVPRSVYHKWCRDGWRQCDALFVHTEGLAQSLRGFLKKAQPPIFVTPPGICNILMPKERSTMPGTRGDPRQLLFFGVMRPNKGLHILLQAMHELPECRLTIAGDFKEASYKKKILTEIARLPREQVNLIDRFVDDDEIAGIFARSGLLVLPYTFFFAQSAVLRLAVQFGLPVVASNVGGLEESIEDWRVGTCVVPNDPKALAKGIRSMMEPMRYESAKRATELVRASVNWRHTARLTWQAYLSILDSAV